MFTLIFFEIWLSEDRLVLPPEQPVGSREPSGKFSVKNKKKNVGLLLALLEK